jgi:cytochrome c oxidase assembly protein subunit 15
MKTPLSWLAERVRFGPTNLTIAAGTALAASVMIVVTGSIVRVTGSGLGCDTWPNCTAETLAPTAEMGVHGLIEFGNRLLAIVLCVIVGWLIVVARLQRDADPVITRWAWAQFWVIVLNAVVGGLPHGQVTPSCGDMVAAGITLAPPSPSPQLHPLLLSQSPQATSGSMIAVAR